MKLFSNKAYDILKWISMVFLGAFGEFYNQMSEVWGLPYGEGVATTCFRLATFLGACLGISAIQYKHNEAQRERAAHMEILQQYNALQDELNAQKEDENDD
jgi:low affinity Fe/Cu permease